MIKTKSDKGENDKSVQVKSNNVENDKSVQVKSNNVETDKSVQVKFNTGEPDKMDTNKDESNVETVKVKISNEFEDDRLAALKQLGIASHFTLHTL